MLLTSVFHRPCKTSAQRYRSLRKRHSFNPELKCQPCGDLICPRIERGSPQSHRYNNTASSGHSRNCTSALARELVLGVLLPFCLAFPLSPGWSPQHLFLIIRSTCTGYKTGSVSLVRTEELFIETCFVMPVNLDQSLCLGKSTSTSGLVSSCFWTLNFFQCKISTCNHLCSFFFFLNKQFKLSGFCLHFGFANVWPNSWSEHLKYRSALLP